MKTIITRADDCGSSRGANQAVIEAAGRGFVKNISLMAGGAFIGESAFYLKDNKRVCFGMHFTMNSEWDRVKYAPVSEKESIRDILDKGGEFYSSPEALSQVLADRDDIGRGNIGRNDIGRGNIGRDSISKDGVSIGSAGKDIGGHADQCLVLEQIETEWRAQLDRLAKLGFNITYADTHMFPERRIPGLKEALRSWCQEKGLIDHRYFYHVLPHIDGVSKEEGLFEHVLAGLADGQYFYLSHPAYPSEDMYLTGNREVSTQDLVRDREADYRFVVSEDTLRLCSEYGVKLIRYDEALPGDYESAETWLGGGK